MLAVKHIWIEGFQYKSWLNSKSLLERFHYIHPCKTTMAAVTINSELLEHFFLFFITCYGLILLLRDLKERAASYYMLFAVA